MRLFSEEDYLARERFATPEILRTNLAWVILQTKALRLGDIERFPFLDPPRPDAIRDGFKTLFELGAVDEDDSLTETGRRMARIPVDPRIGRMILAAADEGCLSDVLVIASALEIQDPRERPLEKQEQADTCHAPFADPDSDFLSYLKLWDFFQELRERSRGTNSTRRAGSTSCRSTGCGSGSTSTGNSCNWWNRRGLWERQAERLAGDRGPPASRPRTRAVGRSHRRPRFLPTGRSSTRQFTGRS